MTKPETPAVWIDGHPQLEAIAALTEAADFLRDAHFRDGSASVAELAHALDNATPYPIELDSALCAFMAERLLEMLAVHKRPEHAVWQPEEEPELGEQPQPEDPTPLAAPDGSAEPAHDHTETLCGPVPDQCDAEAGDPCANHEREQAHAEGEHCFCGPECTVVEVVHGCPPDGSGLTPCCGRTPFELPLTDRISSEAPVTCTGGQS